MNPTDYLSIKIIEAEQSGNPVDRIKMNVSFFELIVNNSHNPALFEKERKEKKGFFFLKPYSINGIPSDFELYHKDKKIGEFDYE